MFTGEDSRPSVDRPVRRSGARGPAARGHRRIQIGGGHRAGCGGASDGSPIWGSTPYFARVSFGIQIALASAWRRLTVLHYGEQFDKGGRTTMAAGRISTGQDLSRAVPRWRIGPAPPDWSGKVAAAPGGELHLTRLAAAGPRIVHVLVSLPEAPSRRGRR